MTLPGITHGLTHVVTDGAQALLACFGVHLGRLPSPVVAPQARTLGQFERLPARHVDRPLAPAALGREPGWAVGVERRDVVQPRDVSATWPSPIGPVRKPDMLRPGSNESVVSYGS